MSNGENAGIVAYLARCLGAECRRSADPILSITHQGQCPSEPLHRQLQHLLTLPSASLQSGKDRSSATALLYPSGTGRASPGFPRTTSTLDAAIARADMSVFSTTGASMSADSLTIFPRDPSAPPLPTRAELDSSIGALLIGTFIATMIYGLTLCQTFWYYQMYPRDVRIIKIFVPMLLFVETMHTVLTFDSCYFYLVINYMSPSGLLVFRWSLQLLVPLTGVTSMMCQLFYARRVWLFGVHHRKYVILATAFVIAKISCTIYASVRCYESNKIIALEESSWVIAAAYGCATIVDGILTGTLIYVLLKSRSGLKQSDSVVQTLVTYTINTGLLTSIVSVAVFILALILPHGLIWAAVTFVSNKLNANAVLAALNTRRSVSARLFADDAELETIGAQLHGRRAHPAPTLTTGRVPETPPQISIKFRTMASTTSGSGTESSAAPTYCATDAHEEHDLVQIKARRDEEEVDAKGVTQGGDAA
ncbi:hypothetical protein ONZ51_g8106 [Trametes cubensis]|uniref:DUF6534 domain-containing protein n=1 Tax=Trametes cubensis TaxID=1111947 RepID=A0AAD7XB39_9APHY|nr:hypothetical protein ONZ51_g8106 [Trametes cubensis]